MKTRVAVTYENGQVFQHFGHTEQFQIFTVEDGKILSEEIVSTNGSGHSLLADFLVVQGATVLICGGNGGGRPDFAMAGAKDQSKLDDALAAVPELVKKQLG